MARESWVCAPGQTTKESRNVVRTRHRARNRPGIGHLYAVTTNPPQASGIGLAIAARAGAVLADTEFVQFHPPPSPPDMIPAPLASEALRGEGAFWSMVPASDSCSKSIRRRSWRRAILCARVFAEIAAGAWRLSRCRTAIGTDFPDCFPTVYASCVRPASTPAHAHSGAPAAHYHMGGVHTDARGRTSLASLWRPASGFNRRACANRLASIHYSKRSSLRPA